jgi:hypothetical protein
MNTAHHLVSMQLYDGQPDKKTANQLERGIANVWAHD